MNKLLQTLIDGLAVGSLYGLIALGYTMVYGILQFINFAHSDIFMMGAWISYVVASAAGWARADAAAPAWGLPLVLLAAMAACGLAGLTIERLAYKPLRAAPRLNVLITAIGVSLFLENAGQLEFLFGTRPRRLPDLLPTTPIIKVGEVPIVWVDVAVVAVALLLMAALQWLVFKTKLGLGMRAVAYDTRTASLMGVNVDRVISFTFVIGSSLAAAAGLLYGLKYPGLNQPAHANWILLGLKAFVAAVVGGIGDIRGAMVGGLLIGFIELFGAAYLSPHYKDVYVFSILIFVLLVRPTGLFGRTLVEKV